MIAVSIIVSFTIVYDSYIFKEEMDLALKKVTLLSLSSCITFTPVWTHVTLYTQQGNPSMHDILRMAQMI